MGSIFVQRGVLQPLEGSLCYSKFRDYANSEFRHNEDQKWHEIRVLYLPAAVILSETQVVARQNIADPIHVLYIGCTTFKPTSSTQRHTNNMSSVSVGNRMLRSQRYMTLIIFTVLVCLLFIVSFSAHQYVDKTAISESLSGYVNTVVDWTKSGLDDSSESESFLDDDENDSTVKEKEEPFPFTLPDSNDNTAGDKEGQNSPGSEKNNKKPDGEGKSDNAESSNNNEKDIKEEAGSNTKEDAEKSAEKNAEKNSEKNAEKNAEPDAKQLDKISGQESGSAAKANTEEKQEEDIKKDQGAELHRDKGKEKAIKYGGNKAKAGDDGYEEF